MSTQENRPEENTTQENNLQEDHQATRPDPAPNSGSEPVRETGAAPASTRSAPRRGGALWLLATLPGLAALGWLLWLYVNEPGADSGAELEAKLAGMAAELDARDTQIARLEQTVQSLESRLQPPDFSPLERELDAVQRDLGGVEDRVARQLERMGERLEGFEPAPELEQRVVLAETAALLRLGGERLELAGDHQTARQAYARAAERLAASDDPRLAAVQRQVAREAQALAGWQPPDWGGIAGRLRALAEQAGDWPVRPEKTYERARPDEPRSLRGRAWRALDSLVTIRRAAPDTLTPSQADDLRRLLRSRLAAAELEAIRHDADALRAALAPVRETLAQYFDPDDAGVAQALEVMDQVQAQTQATQPPALGEAARQLQALLAR